MAPRLVPLSPEWWVSRLYCELVERAKCGAVHDDYYRGDHPLPWLAAQAQDEFRRILRMTRSNYMGLVVDSVAERLMIEGFRLGVDQEDGDAETWRIWQANNLDSDSDQLWLESLIAGQSYGLVEVNPKDPKTPNIYVEHPSQAIVEYVPGSGRRERAAGLKVWDDEWTDLTFATLYLPGNVFKFQAKKRSNVASKNVRWERREVSGEEWGGPNVLKVVSLVEIPNNPRLLTGGVSELADVTDIQDRINKTIADRMITQDYGAFPQKWVAGWPTHDEKGNPTPEIDAGRNRIVTTDIKDTKFGQWEAAPLDPYSAAKREDVKDIASRTRTPAQYLLGEMNNVNGETLKASESGLISKTRQRMRSYGEGVEELMRLARVAAGLSVDGTESMETMWRDPEYRTEGERVDALVKMSTLEVPTEALWERWGATATERERWKKMRAEDKQDPVLSALADKLGPAAPVPPAPGMPMPGPAN